jgi:hypothetical protein
MKNTYTIQMNGNIVIYTMTENQFNHFCTSHTLCEGYNFEIISVEHNIKTT